jgi:wobble nucleotide-excising tRNase
MLKKIIEIRNVGRFLNSALPRNPTLAKHTLVFGGNGFGKTTLCAILRSLATGDPAYISGRKTLGITADPEIEFLLDGGVAKFQDATWSRTVPDIAVYDSQFIAENVHSGDVVDLEHKRAFYRIIIGKEGINLAQKDERLAGETRAKTGDVRTAERAIQIHISEGLGLDEFLKLPADTEVDGRIAEQEKMLNAVRQNSQI